MPKEPLVSIIIPVYNVEKFLPDCLDSVINQTYRNLEIILVDDGSTDNSKSICDRAAIMDERVLVIRKQNGGLNRARESGYNSSKGEYILFVDSDDMIDITAVEKLLYVTKKQNSDIVIGGYKTFQRTEEIDIYGDNKIPDSICEDDKSVILNWLIRSAWTKDGGPEGDFYMQTAWMKLFKRKVIDNIDWSYSDYKAHEDEFMAMQYYSRLQGGVSIVPQHLYFYRQNPQSIMNSAFTNTFKGRSISKFETIEHIRQKSIDSFGVSYEKEVILRFAFQYLLFMRIYIDKGELSSGFVGDYKKYFLPRLGEIDSLREELGQAERQQLKLLNDLGVMGYIGKRISEKNNYIKELESKLIKASSIEDISGVVRGAPYKLMHLIYHKMRRD